MHRIAKAINPIAILVLSIFSAAMLHAAESRLSWQTDWERTLKAAEAEGAVTIYMTQAFESVFREGFQKRFSKIKVNSVTGRGFQLAQRIMNERRGDKYIPDLYIGGNVSPLTVFHKARILEPIKPLLVLPEVLDPAAWFEGQHHYNDPERQYIYIFEGTPRSGEITYNTNLVNPAEFRSYRNLLDPKWKGKIVTVDPLIAGPINSAQVLFFKHPELGPEFVRRLYGETDMTIVRANEQLMDWLSAGKFAMGFGARDVDNAIAQGLPLNQFPPGHMKEGASLAAYNGTLSFFNRAPHPNAAKIAVNWLLSREGQSTWLDHNARTVGQYDSLREDIAKDKVSEHSRRVKGGRYLEMKPEWIEEISAIRDFIKRALPQK